MWDHPQKLTPHPCLSSCLLTIRVHGIVLSLMASIEHFHPDISTFLNQIFQTDTFSVASSESQCKEATSFKSICSDIARLCENAC